MDIRGIARRIAPPTLPPAAGKVVIDQRDGWRFGMRVAAGASAGVAGGAAIIGAQDGAPLNGVSLGMAATGAALVAGSFLMPSAKVPVLRTGLADLPAAVTAADEAQRAVGVIENGGSYHLLDLQQRYNLDDATRELSDLRVGDGRVKFEALVTQDGDLLKPAIAGNPRGYVNTGSAAPRLNLNSLDAGDTDAIENALRGRQLGTDADHAVLRAGSLRGSRQGYASAEEGVKRLARQSGESALFKVGDRHFAFEVDGPARQWTRLRGTTIEPYGDITMASRKAAWTGTGPGERFAFDRRVLPFTPDEPIGQRLSMHGEYVGTPSGHLGAHADQFRAENEIIRRGRRAPESSGRIHTNHFAVVEGDNPGARHHVYELSGARDGWWEGELGAIRAHTWTDESKRTQRSWDRDWVEHQRRQALMLHGERGHHTIKDTGWHTYRRSYDRPPRDGRR